jgi:GTP pyrophosphokinase
MACHAHALGIREDKILATILLHDVCEDCGVAPEELPFSEEVREAVRLLSFQAKPGETRTEAKKRYYAAIAENRIARIVKILDRCNNISTMASSFTQKKLVAYVNETETYVMPMLEEAKYAIPEYADAFYLLKYHMRSVLESIKAMATR